MPVVKHIPTSEAVALTIDDGPNSATTPMLLSLLEHYDAKATFFALGRNVEAHPELAQAIVDAGHDLCNHGYSHRSFLELTPREIRQELTACEDLLSRFRPKPAPYVLRPPYGHHDEQVLQTIEQWHPGSILAMWCISPCEWRALSKMHTPSQVLETCRRRVDRIDRIWEQGILLMHDWPTRGNDPNLTDGPFAPLVCATVMELYLQVTAAKGLKCLRLSDCTWKD